MRVLIQRVSTASVTIDGHIVGHIAGGVLVLVGVTQGDTKDEAMWIANKIARLRIFEDEYGKMNLSLLETGGAALVVSQFTLYADTRKGRRPSFIRAATPSSAEPLVRYLADQISAKGIPVEHGEFGAYMEVSLVNDGPVTIWLEHENTRHHSSDALGHN